MVEREILSEGTTLLFEEVPGVVSASIGVWLRMGSRHEPARLSGICHFIEHLVFKGTGTRTAREISLLTDRIGGNVDAFTTKETTTFYARVLAEHLPIAVELLADIVRNPRFDAEELERERKVILEEIRMVQDSPEERIFDLFCETFWPRSPLGRPIQGTAETVGRMSRRTILEFFRKAYVPQNLVVSTAGCLRDGARERIREAFSNLPPGERARDDKPTRWKPGVVVENRKDLEQVHVLLGLPALPAGDERRFALHLLNTVLGGSISSRLFRRIREERGLVYSVGSSTTSHAGAGLVTVSAATSPEKVQEVLRITLEELRDLADRTATTDEIDVARDHLKGNLLLALESTSSRMSRAAREEMVLGRAMTAEEISDRLDATGPDDVRAIADELFAGARAALTMVGKTAKLRVRDEDLQL